MSGKYLLGNMLSAIHNKKFFYEKPVVVEYNGLCEDVLKVMENAGYVKEFKVVNEDGKKNIEVLLQIIAGKKTINSFRLVSKPGCRQYADKDKIKKMLSYNPFALTIISTSKGVITVKEAVELGIGGEVLCEIF